MMLCNAISVVCLSVVITAERGEASCPEPTGCCPPLFVRVGSACYRVASVMGYPWTWAKNQAACRALGAEIAAPRNQRENALLTTMEPYNLDSWIGCRDEDDDKEWDCEGQEKSDEYRNWEPFQPWDELFAQYSLPYYTCAAYTGVWRSQSPGQWYGVDCSGNFRAVCVRRLRGPRRWCFAPNTNPQFTNWCVVDRVIREFVSQTVAACTSACITEPGCRSVNVKITEQGRKLCELNNATTFDDGAEFQIVNSGCTYYSEHFSACMD